MGPNSTEVSNFFCRTSPDDTWKDGKNLEPLRNFVEYYFIIIFIIYQTKIYVLQRPVLRYMLKRKERDRKDQQIILYFLLCSLWGNLISTRPFAIFQALLWEIMFYSNWRIFDNFAISWKVTPKNICLQDGFLLIYFESVM